MENKDEETGGNRHLGQVMPDKLGGLL